MLKKLHSQAMSECSEVTNTRTQKLFYQEQGGGNETIVLIHGAFSTNEGWDLVIPYLSRTYHLLLPDLPGHGKSADIVPFSKELSARLTADIICERAGGGKAHVVGMSLGAHVAIELASKYPEVVKDVFVSGYEVFASSPQVMAYGLWTDNRLGSYAPRPLLRWLMDDADIKPSANPPSWSLCRSVADALCIKDEQWPSPWPARTLIIAAGKSGILPTADHPHDAKRLRDIALEVQGSGDTKAVTHPDLRHPWDRQRPELFAEAVEMWCETGNVVDGFVEL